MPRSCKKVKRSRSPKKMAKSRRSLKKVGPKLKPNEIRSRFFNCTRETHCDKTEDDTRYPGYVRCTGCKMMCVKQTQ
jgi:hypothetical protein